MTIRDYPVLNSWWLGLLLLDPEYRNQGLGRRIYQSFEEWASHQGAERIFLGVLEENQKAYRFWCSLGFELVEKQTKSKLGNVKHVVITMKRNLSGSKDD
jgi:GNAT superfamily N-acetyltransferase